MSKEKNLKKERGITLIALVVTIVVLLILAAVSINMVLGNNGLISKAKDAKTQTEQDQVNTEKGMNNLYDEMMGILGENSGNGEGKNPDDNTTDFTKVAVGTIAEEHSTINGEMYSSTNPVIPKGFKAINTATSTWGEENAYKNGLVISDGISEFVWIPVEELDSFARVTSGTDANGKTNYQGVLYNFSSTGATEMTSYGQSTTSYREPANLTDSSYADNTSRFSTITWTGTYYQETFNKMVESVAKYKGFYVARYEMSLNASGVAQSKAGETSATNAASSANNWWGLYEKSKTYSTSNTNLGVESEMIWGCQYDAMMKWMVSNNIDVTSKPPTDTARNVTASYNKTRVTGSSSNDLLNNVYDLLGNSVEWTQEADRTRFRVFRGGNYNTTYSPSNRLNNYPTDTNGNYTSRLSLYVK